MGMTLTLVNTVRELFEAGSEEQERRKRLSNKAESVFMRILLDGYLSSRV